MAKKKLAFYDAFKTQPNDLENSDESGSTRSSGSGHIAYTPGDELTLRPKPKNINTSYHSASSQNIEVRAKGSSIPPGAAKQWQKPHVNQQYLKTDGQQPPAKSLPRTEAESGPKIAKNMPSDEDTHLDIKLPKEVYVEEPVQEKKVSVTQSRVKPVSYQSETMPYLDPGDLETQNIPFPKDDSAYQAKQSSPQSKASKNVEYGTDVIVLKPKLAVILVILWVSSIVLTFLVSRDHSTPTENSVDIAGIKEEVENNDRGDVLLNKQRMDESVDATKIIKEVSNLTKQDKKSETNTTTTTSVDKPKNNYTIRAVTVSDENRAKSFVVSLEEDGFKPATIIRTRNGILITVGEFETKEEAVPMLNKLKYKSIRHWKPFDGAYIVKNKK